MPPDYVFAVTPVADALDAIGVPYYLAGSVVSSLHGFARATADVDVVAALRPLHVAQLADRLAGDSTPMPMRWRMRSAVARCST
jgi:hypothetical protein